ncbi:MAG: hypothetical protein ABR608_04280 [Pseudonocardiaceae bacterium]
MMIVLVLLLGALLVAWTAPRLLEYRLHTGTDPQILDGYLDRSRGQHAAQPRGRRQSGTAARS